MTQHMQPRRQFLQALAFGVGTAAGAAWSDEPARREGLREPVFRIAKAKNAIPGVDPNNPHPLDPALEIAHDALARIQTEVNDYTAIVVKRERVKGVLGNYEYMQAKIRNRKVTDGKVTQPLSVYLKFLKPKDIEGREVIWIEGRNNNKMRAHEGGAWGKSLPTVWLDPNGILAMRGQLHPITEIGVENLIAKLIEKGNNDKKYGECEVKFDKGAKINGRTCTVLSVKHPTPRPHFEFHLAQIFIDDAMNLPVRYAAYHWPTDPNDQVGPVIEEYTYLDVKLNVGLKDEDFDPDNPNYGF